ncbi:hypothetical protein IJ579_08890, partial [bacterium]|nr:hypothetical protein [bacterium]
MTAFRPYGGGGLLAKTLAPCAFADLDSAKSEELQDFTWGATQQTQATSELQPSGKCRLGLLPQHVKFPSPPVGEGLGVRGATHTITPPLKKLPSLAREGLRVGLFPARGKHTTTETIPSLFVTLAEPTSLRVMRDCVHGSEASRRGSQRWRAGETYAGGRG